MAPGYNEFIRNSRCILLIYKLIARINPLVDRFYSISENQNSNPEVFGDSIRVNNLKHPGRIR